LAGLAAYFALLGALRSLLENGAALGVYVVLAWMAAAGLWLLTPWLMLGRQVRWRALLPSAVLTATGSLLYTASSTVWMPRTVAENQHQFGFFGVALALVTWLTGAATIIVVSACAGPVFAEDQGWIGRLIRGSGSDSALVEGAAASTAAPASAPRLSRAFGLGLGLGGGDADEDEDDIGDPKP
jgi:membrane protein